MGFGYMLTITFAAMVSLTSLLFLTKRYRYPRAYITIDVNKERAVMSEKAER
jgi:hypothetical protein